MSNEQSIRLYENIPYQNQTLKNESHVKHLDIYRPNNDAILPVVFYVHGGAWFLGSKDEGRAVASTLARTGKYVVVSISYDLSSFSNQLYSKIFVFFTVVLLLLCLGASGKDRMAFITVWIIIATIILILLAKRPPEMKRHPSHINSVAEAFAWTRKNIGLFHGDSSNIVTMGHSCGGHLVSLLSTNPKYLDKVGLSTLDIKGTVAISGVYNDNNLKGGFFQENLLQEIFGRDRAIHIDAFPIHHMNSKIPPMLVLSADRDFILKRHAQEFISVLKSSGVYVEPRLLRNVDHCTIIKNWCDLNCKDNSKCMDIIVDFINRVTI
jgi:acetyl esterase/lipase